MSTKTLMYIGPRPRMVDPLYGTGEWVKAVDGQPFVEGVVKMVPADVAQKMLKHGDVWKEIAVEDPAPMPIPTVTPESTTKDDTEAEEAQKVRDAIAAMDSKQSIADFIAANYSGIKIDKRLSLDAMKQEAVRTIDQYGVSA